MQQDKFAQYQFRACREYIRSNGDIDAVWEALRREVPKTRIKAWAVKQDWEGYLKAARVMLGEELGRKEAERRLENLTLLESAKAKLTAAMEDVIDPQTQKLVRRAALPKSLEDCVRTLLEVFKFEQTYFAGASTGKESTKARPLESLAQRMQKNAAEAAKPKAVTNVDRSPDSPSASALPSEGEGSGALQ